MPNDYEAEVEADAMAEVVRRCPTLVDVMTAVFNGDDERDIVIRGQMWADPDLALRLIRQVRAAERAN